MAKNMAGVWENPAILFTVFLDVVINTTLKLSLALVMCVKQQWQQQQRWRRTQTTEDNQLKAAAKETAVVAAAVATEEGMMAASEMEECSGGEGHREMRRDEPGVRGSPDYLEKPFGNFNRQ